MSAVSLREKRLVIITLLIVAYAVVGFTARKRLDAWERERRAANAAKSEYRDRENLIGRHEHWKQKYEDVRDLMPVFPHDARVDTHWLKVLDDKAHIAGITIGKRQPPVEKLDGDVYEMTIECTDWKGSLEGILQFLYQLQLAGVMLDVRTLFVRPVPQTPGQLTGRFTFVCSYMRAPPSAGETP